ncbi:MAG TPA: glycosyltransferase family 39 protein [Gemmatimonadaceae bacterium]|nr:glycosyltransferase family 39 protein [Gemmatimonadaceae bacterium]
MARVTGRTGPALVLFSVVALLIRCLIAARGGLWRDEALFLFIVRFPSWSAMLEFLRLHESHPPLFYALMRLWLPLAGNGDMAARLLPVGIGVAIVPAIYLVGASLFSSRVGLLASGLAAISPALSAFSATARPYSLLPLVALISSYTLIRGLERGGRGVWTGHVVASLALLYTHNWGWLVLFGEWLAASLVLLIGVGRGRATAMREWLVAQIVIGIAYLPWAPRLVFQAQNAGHAPLLVDGWKEMVGLVALSAGVLLRSTIFAYPAVLPTAVLGAGELRRVRRDRAAGVTSTVVNKPVSAARSTRASLIVVLVVPVTAWLFATLLSPRSNLILARCLVTLAPLMLLALAHWLVGRRGGVMPLWWAVLAALVATYCVALVALIRTTPSNARELAAAVTARTEPSDLLIIAPEPLASSFNYYYVLPIEQIDFPHFGREEAVDFAGLANRVADPVAFTRVKQRIAEARCAGRRAWLIVDASQVHEFSAESIRRVLRSADFNAVAAVRANQIREELVSHYGAPDTTVAVRGRAPRYEELRAFLFTPEGACARR